MLELSLLEFFNYANQKISDLKNEVIANGKTQTERKQLSLEQFSLYMSGTTAFRKTPGIPAPVFEQLYLCRDVQSMYDLRKFLETYFQIRNSSDVKKRKNAVIGIHKDYEQFSTFWNGSTPVDTSKLTKEAADFFNNCKEFAILFKDILGKGGFYAFDCAENIGAFRYAYAAGFMDKEQYFELVMPMAEKTMEYFESWLDYSVSLVVGAAYLMYKQSGYNFEQVKKYFDLNVNTVRLLFLNEETAYWNKSEFGFIKETVEE